MAKNTGEDYRIGSVKKRVQQQDVVTGEWIKFDTETGKEIERKEGNGFKGVAKVVDDRLKQK